MIISTIFNSDSNKKQQIFKFSKQARELGLEPEPKTVKPSIFSGARAGATKISLASALALVTQNFLSYLEIK